MKKVCFKQLLSLILCLVLTAAVALMAVSCDNQPEVESPATESQTESTTTTESAPANATGSSTESETDTPAPIVKGEGNTVFPFTVVDGEGRETRFEIHTNEKTVGAALQKAGLLQGEDGPYGLYVKVVNGITADYDKTGTYWAFYINGQYGMSGVDTTPIKAGEAYQFKVEKG